MDMDVAFVVPGAYHGGFLGVTKEPSSIHLHLGAVAWRWVGGCGGDRCDYDDCHVTAGDELLDLCAAPAACRFVGGVGRVMQLCPLKSFKTFKPFK